jgi:hypothetical protein
MTPDPLSEKYYGISPYAFCNNDPVNFVDLDGEDIWEIDKDGVITWKNKLDEHRLYSLNAENNRGDNYIVVKNPEILKNLEGEGVKQYTSVDGVSDFLKVFKFAADNSNVEWALHQSEDNEYTITTIHDELNAGSWEDLGISKPKATIHSHPNVPNTTYDENFSMGFVREGNNKARAFLDYDWDNVRKDIEKNHLKARRSYVYFPNSNNIYYITYNGPKLIKTF